MKLQINSTDKNYVCQNVKIIGKGTITGDNYRANYAPIKGNATALAIDEGSSADTFYDIANSETAENNIRSRIRGRLINVSNAQNVYIKGVTVAKPPMWTVHMIYSDNVTTNGVTFNTSGYRNGDGWDPDSSTNCTIYGCNFNTGDDCVAIKSGKNPEGNAIGKTVGEYQNYQLHKRGRSWLGCRKRDVGRSQRSLCARLRAVQYTLWYRVKGK